MEEDYYSCTNAAVNKRTSGGGGYYIPTFGNWDFTNDLPITQYFECARQAGVVRYSSSSGESDPRAADLYSVGVDQVQEPRGGRGAAYSASASRKGNEKRHAHVKEQKKEGRIFDVTQQPPKTLHVSQHHTVLKSKVPSDAVYPRPGVPNKPPKAVDGDLYEIPPELLNRKKKKLGFMSRCLVPACAAD